MKPPTNLKMLIVEDEPHIGKIIELIFRARPYQFFHAGDGEEGMKEAKREMPDVIITDLMMPIIDGVDFIKSLRKLPDFATTPIIAITAADDIKIEDAKKAGAHLVLPKPLKASELLESLDNLLSSSPFVPRRTTPSSAPQPSSSPSSPQSRKTED
jgi:DNA-binding response OmpR family regulator